MEKNKLDYLVIFLMAILFICILFLFINLFTKGIDSIKKDNICQELYPSIDGKTNSLFENVVWEEGTIMEEGYISCCRYNYVDHKQIKECKTFKKINKG